MSWKSLFYKSSEEPKKEVVEEVKETVSVSNLSVAPIGGESSIGIPSVVTGVVTEKYVNIFAEKLESINIEGEDYHEYKESLDSLSKVKGMNEMSIYVSAFAALQGRGLNYATLLSSIDFYTLELNNEKELFKNAQSEKYEETIGVIDTEVSKLNKSNELANEQILALTEQIKANSILIAEKNGLMEEGRISLETEQNNFDVSLSLFITSMENDKTKIEQYLKTNA